MKRSPRKLIVTSAAVVAATALLTGQGTAALAASETAGASGIYTTGLLLNVAKTPNASCVNPTDVFGPPSVGVTVPGLADVGAPNATCTSTTSHASVAYVKAFPSAGRHPTYALDLTTIYSDCGPTGASSQVAGTINGQNLGDGSYHDITIPGVAEVRVNETEASPNADGETVQNAVHIILLGGTPAQHDVYLAQSRCKVTSAPVLPEVSAAVLLPLTAVGIFGVGLVLMRRRRETGVAAL